ncbi:uncharacterized protein LOC113313208 [Papaver somniferum]|uniref:uncharacterized protein LOC113313208 n=1 Tax=Papaver somniferum TaxID=3469 RepID=UPI000E6FE1DC|nr:uncharacterized protein LOC113313208 [Papaver somniferum]
MRSLPKKFRKFKYDLRNGPLLGKVTMQEKLDACPDDYDTNWWKVFVENESKPGVKEKHEKYAENQKKRTLHHTCGRESYANKIHKLAKKEGLVVEAARGLAWMDGHVGKDGTINISAVEKYEQVKAARAKRKELIDAGLISALDFQNDEIVEVFGPDNRITGLLGYSPLLSKKQALYASVATAVMAAKTTPTSNAPRTDHMDEALLQKHTELITNVVMQVMAKQQQNQHSAGHNDIKFPDRNRNPGTVGMENPNGNQLVLLYKRKRETVATGHVMYGTEGEYCHGVLLYEDERKVCLETTEDGNCPVPDSPQGDDCYYLKQFVAKEWVVWHVSRMDFVESGCE